MEFIYILIALAIAVQLGIFVMNRQKKKAERKDLLTKYNIRTRGDLFKMINSHSLPEEDRLLLEQFYQQKF